MCGQHNVRASAGDSIGQNANKGHTPNPRTEIKVPDPAVNRTRAAGLEGRDSTDHAMATDSRFDPAINKTKRAEHINDMCNEINWKVIFILRMLHSKCV